MSETDDFENWQRDRATATRHQALDEIVKGAIDDLGALLDEARTIRAYDDFAKEALRSSLDDIFRDTNRGEVTISNITAKAWDIADAMMAERKKRGLGYIEADESVEGESHGE